ncbi:PAS domain S-box protein [Enterovirga sp.]|uniref:sensor histidine kinase n=1 Tax=Enterovirga sp. TaxID=2026350 RepID=UPI002BC2EDA4|nr:PAS domain S-box protein [Enterovirga sp.]HMO28428.1 PAS domain S-box protein [Enterovirga sp.]
MIDRHSRNRGRADARFPETARPPGRPPKTLETPHFFATAPEALEADPWLAAIVEHSNDAILSKTLDGVITSWNRSAERLFGFTAAEAIGRSITIIIPENRLHEEEDILRRIKAGQVVEHFETVRRRKDGELIDISVTISPVRNKAGDILGASKIAQDATAQKRARAEQALLLREIQHRIKNLFSLASGLVSLSARGATTATELATDLRGRLHALARAHSLTLHDIDGASQPGTEATFLTLLEAILAPYRHEHGSHIAITGDDVPLARNSLTSAALLLHELSTNAAKYGALSSPQGRLDIEVAKDGDRLLVRWIERSEGVVASGPRQEGFGTKLEQAALQGMMGQISRNWSDGELTIEIAFPLDTLTGQPR